MEVLCKNSWRVKAAMAKKLNHLCVWLGLKYASFLFFTTRYVFFPEGSNVSRPHTVEYVYNTKFQFWNVMEIFTKIFREKFNSEADVLRCTIKYFKERNFCRMKFAWHFHFAWFFNNFLICWHFDFAFQPKYYISRHFKFAILPKYHFVTS